MAVHMRALKTALVIASLGVVVQCGGVPGPRETGGETPAAGPAGFVAAAVTVDPWRLDGEPQVHVGDALFELINGGAELYHRHGFVQALSAEYADGDGRSIALEIFEMSNVEGARRVFAEKAGGSGEAVDLGDEARLESYYMNLRTGPYLVTLTGFEGDPGTTEGIVALAGAVAAELGGER